MNKRLVALTAAALLGITSPVLAGPPHGHGQGHGHANGHGPGKGHKHGHGHSHGRGGERYDYAKVIAVHPIVRYVQVSTPRQVCWTEDVVHHEPGHRSAVPPVIGGIVGGVVGNQFGSGRGKDAATAAGALLGVAIGNDISRQHAAPGQSYVTTQQRCRTELDYHQEERIDGYRVTYRYNGRTHTTHTHEHPGVQVRVSISATL